MSSLEAAIAAVGKEVPTSLLLEANSAAADPPDAEQPDTEPLGRIEVLSATATEYHFRVRADRPAWLFLADANYPGWTASVDGARAPVFSAEVLGKAVPISAGSHEIVVRFSSPSFIWGLTVSLLSSGVLAALLWSRRSCRSTSQLGCTAAAGDKATDASAVSIRKVKLACR